MSESHAISQLYEQYLLKEVITSNTELLTSFMEQKKKIIQEMPNKESKDKISMLCDLLTDVGYEDTKRAFAEGFSIAVNIIIKDLEKGVSNSDIPLIIERWRKMYE